MKPSLFIICVLASMGACKKGGPGPAGLAGTWELRHYSGTIAGVSKDVPANSGKYYQFGADSTFKHFTDFKQDNQGSFRVIKNSIDFGGQKYDGIYFSNREDGDYIILKADSLIIGNTFPDGVTSLYIRKNK